MNRQEALIKFCEEHNIFDDLGTLCIVGCGFPTIGKLVAIAEESDDYYYVIMYHDRGLILNTCVDRCQSLKGKIDEYDYHLKAFDGFSKLNPHFLDRHACNNFDIFKNNFKGDKIGIYCNKEEIINNYINVEN